MQHTEKTKRLLAKSDAYSPSGHAIALHVRFTSPTYLFQTYDPTWVNIYTTEGYLINDPTVHWGFANTGTTRWSDIDLPDPNRIMEKSAEYGIKYGACIACEIDGSRSIASFARADREYQDDEIAEIEQLLIELHNETLPAN